MLPFILSLILSGVVVVMIRHHPKFRPFLLWGALFGLPFIFLEYILAGSFERLGTNLTDSVLTFVGLTLIGAAGCGLIGIIYHRTLDRWLSPQPHPDRSKLWILAIGPIATMLALVFGQPAIVACLVGLLVNGITVALAARQNVMWEGLLSAVGLALFFVGLDLIFGIRPSGDMINTLSGDRIFGVSLFGRPAEELLFMALAGALLGPLYAATKPWRVRATSQPRPVTAPVMVMGLSVVVLVMLGVTWLVYNFALPPQVAKMSPALRGRAASTDTSITVVFSHPIDRDSLQIRLTPDVDGAWTFERPSAGRHGYRLARFVPSTTLLPETTYQGHIQGVRSVYGSEGEDIPIRFTTRSIPNIERVTGTAGTQIPSGADKSVATITEPCDPMSVRLTSTYDQSVEFRFALEPAVDFTSDLLPDQRTYKITPVGCLDEHVQYLLRIQRQVVQRDASSQEIVAASDPVTVLETLLSMVRIEAPAEFATAQLVLGSSTESATLKPVRPKTVLPIAMDYQDQPLSCEAAALKMALSRHGVKVSEKSIMKKIGYDPTPRRRGVWGDPDRAFVGNIAGRQNTSGYGVHWQPIAKAATAWRDSRTIRNATPELLAKQIADGHPVVIWGTLGSAYRDSWRTPSGKVVQAWKGEHARTVIGFYGTTDKPTHFVINDPIAGRVTWTRATLVKNWAAFRQSGVVVL